MPVRDDYAPARRRMVETQIKTRGVADPAVLKAMLEVPRHLFVEAALVSQAYGDYPIQIGRHQTISQPYMVAVMTEALKPKATDRILEIGTGSGYQAAVLSRIVEKVYTIERLRELLVKARRVLDRLGYANILTKLGDGTLGWPEEGPFDGVIVTAGAPEIPQPLLDQIKPGGRLVVPVGDRTSQMLKVIEVGRDGAQTKSMVPCRFVNLIGQHGWTR